MWQLKESIRSRPTTKLINYVRLVGWTELIKLTHVMLIICWCCKANFRSQWLWEFSVPDRSFLAWLCWQVKQQSDASWDFWNNIHLIFRLDSIIAAVDTELSSLHNHINLWSSLINFRSLCSPSSSVIHNAQIETLMETFSCLSCKLAIKRRKKSLSKHIVGN
jgi:hypothetical protein